MPMSHLTSPSHLTSLSLESRNKNRKPHLVIAHENTAEFRHKSKSLTYQSAQPNRALGCQGPNDFLHPGTPWITASIIEETC